MKKVIFENLVKATPFLSAVMITLGVVHFYIMVAFMSYLAIMNDFNVFVIAAVAIAAVVLSTMVARFMYLVAKISLHQEIEDMKL